MNRIELKIFVIFIFARILDLGSTYYSHNGKLDFETSPLVRVFNLDWSGLIFINILFIFLIYYLLTKVYSDKDLKLAELNFKNDIHSFTDYFSLIYYRRKINFKDLFISKAFNSNIFKNSFILIFPLVLSIFSFLVSINNFLVGNSINLLSGLKPTQITIILTYTLIIYMFLALYIYNLYRYYKIKKSNFKSA